MDRLAALADILPPPPPAPLPPLPWWQMPWVGWTLAAVLLLVAWGVLGWRRRRVWTRLQRQARAARTDDADTAPAATQLAAALRLLWPESAPRPAAFASGPPRGMRKLGAARRFLISDWPQTMRTRLDELRFAPRPDAARLRQIALGVESASARAARAAWWSRVRAQRHFVQTLRAATQEVR